MLPLSQSESTNLRLTIDQNQISRMHPIIFRPTSYTTHFQPEHSPSRFFSIAYWRCTHSSQGRAIRVVHPRRLVLVIAIHEERHRIDHELLFPRPGPRVQSPAWRHAEVRRQDSRPMRQEATRFLGCARGVVDNREVAKDRGADTVR